MGILRATGEALARSLDTGGRCARTNYWLAMAGLALVLVAVGVLDALTLRGIPLGNGLRLPLVIPLWLLLLPAMLAASVRRLHDTGMRGWPVFLVPPLVLVLMWSFVVSAASALSTMPPTPSVRLATAIFPFALVIAGTLCVLLLWQLARPGKAGPNRFGPNPSEVRP